MTIYSKDPLANSKWVEFCSKFFNISYENIEFCSPGGLKATMVIYYNGARKIITPPLSNHVPIIISGTLPQKSYKANREIRALMEEISKWLSKQECFELSISHLFNDIRSIDPNTFISKMKYTFILDLPHDLSLSDPSIRKNINKGYRSGFEYRKATLNDIKGIQACIKQTQERQKFQYGISDQYLFDVISGPVSSVVSSNVAVFNDQIVGFRAVVFEEHHGSYDLIAAVLDEHLKSGVTQGLIYYILKNLHDEYKCTYFDFGGANLKSVSVAKESWGGHLTGYFHLSKLSTIGKAKKIFNIIRG